MALEGLNEKKALNYVEKAQIVDERRLSQLAVDGDFLLGQMRYLAEEQDFYTTYDGIPSDAFLVKTRGNGHPFQVVLVIGSATFKPVPENQEPPMLNVYMTRHQRLCGDWYKGDPNTRCILPIRHEGAHDAPIQPDGTMSAGVSWQ